MKKIKFISALMVCITLFMSIVSVFNKSYAKINQRDSYLYPSTPFEHNAMYILDIYAANSTGGDASVEKTYEVTQEMVNNKKAILAKYIGTEPVDASMTSKLLSQMCNMYKGSDETAAIKKLFTEALSCNESDITIQNIYSSPAITEANVKALDPVMVTSETELKDTKDLVEKVANHEIAVAKGLKDELNAKKAKEIEEFIEKMKDDSDDSEFSYNKDPLRVLGHCHFNVFETKVIVKNVGTYSFVISNGEDKYKNRFYYVYRDDLEEKPDFATSLDYECVEGTEVKKKATSQEENPFLPYYTDNDNNKKDTDAIAYIRSKTDEKIVSVDGVELKTDGRENEKGWYYPDTTNQKVVAKKYLFDTYNNKNDNGKVNEKVEVVGENGGKSQENPNIEWTFRRKIKEEDKKDDGSTVVTITYNLPIDESKVEDGWSMIRDDDGAVRKITRTFKKNEGYDKDVVAYQNGTGKEVKTPVKLTAPVISKTGETTFFVIALIVIASVVVVTSKRKIK